MAMERNRSSFRACIIADERRQAETLSSELASMGVSCLIAPDGELSAERVAERTPDVVLVAMNGMRHSPGAKYLAQANSEPSHPPVIALVSVEILDSIDPAAPIDDFVIKPWNAAEVAFRVRRTVRRKNGVGKEETIRCGDLTIDVARCEVTVGGRLVTLTFKEFELLRFLASNRGRVFTRDALLNEIWGHDYYGGDRTVDVHIRRLRSKIEDSTHTFVDTVRNIGYKFRESGPSGKTGSA